MDASAIARACAERDTVTEGIEMVLAAEDGRGLARAAGEEECADGRSLAALMRAAADVMFPDARARDLAAIARIGEVVAAHEFGDGP